MQYKGKVEPCPKCAVVSIILADLGICLCCHWEERGDDTTLFREIQKRHNSKVE